MSDSRAALHPKLRADLSWTTHTAPRRWVVQDPLTAAFYTFNDLEKAAVELMDGQRNLPVIVQQLRQTFPHAAVGDSWLQALVSRLRLHHLLVAGDRRDTRRLVVARHAHRGRGILQQLLSPLAIRVPLLDPMPIVSRLVLPASLLFQPWMVMIWIVVGSLLMFLVLREFLGSHFSLAVDLNSIQGDRWLMLFLCYVVAKSLHELGHMLACVHFRVRCSEVGILFLCLAPCLYCDTTDSWKLPSKWQRAAIAAAGMYVELILATLAAGVWLLTGDGSLHFIAASMMVVCSVGTLFINSNPFLKYDGYYILSDLWGVPNLAEQSREAVRALCLYALTGRRPAQTRFDANIWLLSLYAAVSTVYRVFVLCLILWFCWHALVPLGLGMLAAAVTLAILSGMIMSQFRLVRNFAREFSNSRGTHFFRLALCSTLVIALLGTFLTWPIPTSIQARAITDYAEKIPMYANQSAELVYTAPVGAELPPRSRLIAFQSTESQLEWIELNGEIQAAESILEQLHLRSTMDPATSYQIPAKTEELAKLKARQKVLQRERETLVHYAPTTGRLLYSDNELPRPITATVDDRFGVKPLDFAALGSHVDRSALVGWFVPQQQLVLTALVPEESVKLLAIDGVVHVAWDSDSANLFRGRIVRISPDPLAETPQQLIGDPMVISSRTARGVFRPETAHYEVTVELDAQPTQSKLLGSLATIQVPLASKTLLQRAQEYLQKNLRPIY